MIYGTVLMDTTGTFILPPQSSTIASQVDSLFYFILGVSVFFFVIVIGAATIFIIKYRLRGLAVPTPQSDHNTTLEILWTGIPIIIVILIFAYGFRVYLAQSIAPKDALEIKLTAQRWMWTFTYPNGASSSNELIVPAGKPVKLLMSSIDVIHSFFVPDFRVKQDILPNRYTTVWFEAPDPGDHVITCAEYCGKGHSEMRGTVRVMSAADYAKWLSTSASGPAASEPPEKYGESLYKSKGCVSCHTVDGTASVGPTFKELYGGSVKIEGGQTMKADENYIRTCILEPEKNRLVGFPPVMPTFQGVLKNKDVDAIIAFIKSLSGSSANENESNEGKSGGNK
jgi:cytochrome c oxidase subunit II